MITVPNTASIRNKFNIVYIMYLIGRRNNINRLRQAGGKVIKIVGGLCASLTQCVIDALPPIVVEKGSHISDREAGRDPRRGFPIRRYIYILPHTLAILFVSASFAVEDSSQTILNNAVSGSSLKTISHSHHEAHEGNFYRSGINYTLSNGQVATFSMTVGASVEPHLTWDLTATADGTFTLLEDVTSFSGGAAVTPLNHNRNSSNASGVTCTKGMTNADLITPTGGTTILNAVLATGKGSTVDRGTSAEFIFKSGSKYLFRYTNGTSANIIQIALEWYEE